MIRSGSTTRGPRARAAVLAASAALALAAVVAPAPTAAAAPDAPSPLPGWMSPPAAAPACPAATVRVSTGDELRDALGEAGPGTVIQLADGVYAGRFVADRPATAARPAFLCGGRGAVLDAGDHTHGYGLHLDGADHWVVQGLTVRDAQKGVMVDATRGATLRGLRVHGIGDEAIHLRRGTTDTVVEGNHVSDTGLRRAEFGEGIYVGSSKNNWCDLTACAPDASDRNRVVGNVVHATTAEAVDVKEGTADGVVQGNAFDGAALSGADSWVDVKGNGWLVADNLGRSTPLDGFQTHELLDGWGTRNVFARNSGALDVATGHLVAPRPALANVVECSNALLGTVGRLSPVACVPTAPAGTDLVLRSSVRHERLEPRRPPERVLPRAVLAWAGETRG